jgi:predicted RNA-binding Zn ribbon-like protein
MKYDTYTDGAAQLAVDLANVNSDLEPDATSAEVAEACAAYVAANDEWFTSRARRALTTADVARMVELSDGIRAVATAETDAEAVSGLNALLTNCAPEPRVTDHDGTVHLHYSGDGAPLTVQLGATVSMGLSLLVCRHGRERLGVCAADDCADVYVDTSRNRSRRYCSETCASRTTVSAYRARRRATATP